MAAPHRALGPSYTSLIDSQSQFSLVMHVIRKVEEIRPLLFEAILEARHANRSSNRARMFTGGNGRPHIGIGFR